MLYLGSDHRGFNLKEKLKKYLEVKQIPYTDLGNSQLNPQDDFVDFASLVAKNVQQDQKNLGIALCGSGVGVCVAANKFRNVRCGLGFSSEQIKSAKTHDRINVLALPADFVSIEQAQEIIDAFLKTDFSEEEKYQRRLGKIAQIEDQW